MKKYTYEVLKGIIEAHIEYQLEHSFNRREWVENGAKFELEETDLCYRISFTFAIEKEIKGEAPNDELSYKDKCLFILTVKNQPINILEVLNKVDEMLIEATTPYFG